MLGNQPFSNRTIRKIVVAFGTMFNDISVVRYNKTGVEQERFKVPLSYGAKEKYMTRIMSDPTLTKSIAVVVPRISFNLEGLTYDSSRKQVSTLQNFNYSTTDGLKTQYVPVPYDFNFTVSVYVRNTEDGTQIIEQILPFFTPDFTVTVDFIHSMGKKYDLPVILNSVTTSTEYEGDMLSTRLITWDLDFTVKGWIWPPVKKNVSGLIGGAYANNASNTGISYGAAITNIYTDSQQRNAQQVTVDYANGNNVFTTAETIRVQNKDITGRVIYFSNNILGTLIVGDLTELLQANDVVIGDYSNATYTVNSVLNGPYKNVRIYVQADPVNSDPDDEFGFSETITEYN